MFLVRRTIFWSDYYCIAEYFTALVIDGTIFSFIYLYAASLAFFIFLEGGGGGGGGGVTDAAVLPSTRLMFPILP